MQEMGIYIGRLQPPHNSHIAAIRLALSKAKRLTIILGSACQAKTIKNPWTTAERERMVRACLTPEENARVQIIAAKDYLYRENVWVAAVQSGLTNVGIDDIEEGKISLFGHDKDRSTYYLHLFPNWQFEDTGDLGDIDATRVRTMFFTGDDESLKKSVPWPVYQQLIQEMSPTNPTYVALTKEYEHILEYKRIWAGTPFPPTFITTDAVAIKSGHVLIVKRRGYPGNGLLALPGGYLDQHERIITGSLRELKEETVLDISDDELKKCIVEQRVFDHPERSLRGRTVTYATCFNLGVGPLPKVKGSDDADPNGTGWMPLRDVFANEELFFEDHFHIIDCLVNKF